MPLFPFLPRSEIWVHTPGSGGNSHGSTNTKWRRYTVEEINVGTAITYADSSTNGASFTINEDGYYVITRTDGLSSAGNTFGISKNSNQGTTSIAAITTAHYLAMSYSGTSGATGACSVGTYLSAGDVIRPHDAGTACNITVFTCGFRIVKMGR